MSTSQIVIFSARGRASFTAAQIDELTGAGDTRFVAATGPVAIAELRRELDGAAVVALTPRAARGLRVEQLEGIRLPRAICIPTTGHEWLDVDGLTVAGVRVVTVPGYSSASCAEFTFGLMVSLARRLHEIRVESPLGAGTLSPGMELAGKTLGLVGLGGVGSRVAALGTVLGMQVVGCDTHVSPEGVRVMSLDEVLASSHVLSLHVPLDDRTRHLLDRARIRRLKHGVLVVNTARPGLVETEAMVEAIRHGVVAGYAFDTGYVPLEELGRLLRLPQVLAVPHVSWYTHEAVERERTAWVANIVATARDSHEHHE